MGKHLCYFEYDDDPDSVNRGNQARYFNSVPSSLSAHAGQVGCLQTSDPEVFFSTRVPPALSCGLETKTSQRGGRGTHSEISTKSTENEEETRPGQEARDEGRPRRGKSWVEGTVAKWGVAPEWGPKK